MERVDVVDHLRNGMRLWGWMGYSSCRFCRCRNGVYCVTDGVYVWPEGLAHYLVEHDVRLPQEFVDHVLEMAVRYEGSGKDSAWWTQAAVELAPVARDARLRVEAVAEAEALAALHALEWDVELMRAGPNADDVERALELCLAKTSLPHDKVRVVNFAFNLVVYPPAYVVERVSRAVAEEVRDALVAVGATVRIRPVVADDAPDGASRGPAP